MAPPAAAAAAKHLFAEKEKFVCVHPRWPTVPYPAEVAKITTYQDAMHYRIHFIGWNARQDIWVPCGDEEGAMFKGMDLDAVKKLLDEQQEEEQEDTVVESKTKGKGKKSTGGTPKTPAPTSKPSTSKAATPKTPAAKTPAAKGTPKTPVVKAKTPTAKTPAAKTPAAKKTPTPIPKVAARRSAPAKKTPKRAESEHSEELGEQSDSDSDEEMEVDAPEEVTVPEKVPKKEETPKEQAPDEDQEDQEEEEEAVEEESAEEEEEEEEEEQIVYVELPTRHVEIDDVILHIPENIRQVLVDDASVIQTGFMSKLPAALTIDEIVKMYERQICPNGISNERECFAALVNYKENLMPNTDRSVAIAVLAARSFGDYFNASCWSTLYRQEHKQYRMLIREVCRGADVPDHKLLEAGFRPSSYYGYQHLVRIIATIPDHMLRQQWNDHMMSTLLRGMAAFVEWLDENKEALCKNQYIEPNIAEKYGEAYEKSLVEQN